MDGLDLIRGSHAEGLRLLDSALSRDEEGDSANALTEYRQALAVMAMGLEVRCDLSHCEGADWAKARKMQREMRKRGVQTRGRIKDLERSEKSGLSLSASTTPTSALAAPNSALATPTSASSSSLSVKALGDQQLQQPPIGAARHSPPPPYSERDLNAAGQSASLMPPPYSEFPEPATSASFPPSTAAESSNAATSSSAHATATASSSGEEMVEKDAPMKEPSTSNTPQNEAKPVDAKPVEIDCGTVEVTQELFRINEGVRLFHVNPETQEVEARKPSSSISSCSSSTPTTASSLIIFKLPTPKNRQESFDCLEYILQVDDWIFPLSQHLSPILKTAESIYMFPDLKEEASSVACLATETSIGLVLEPNLVPLHVKFLFEEKLRELAFLLTLNEAISFGLVKSRSFSEVDGEAATLTGATSAVDGGGGSTAECGSDAVSQYHRVQPRGALAADFVARGMLTGASALSQGLVKGAQLASGGIRRGSELIAEKIQPVTAPIAVDPKVKVGIDVAKKGSKAAVVAGGYVLEKLGDATMFVGQKMAPVVKTQANKYLPERFKVGGGEEKDANKITATDKALTLISGGLEGFVTVYQGLEASGRILASSCATEGVKLIDKRYGSEVAQVASSGLETVGNIGYAGYLSGSFGVKALGKRVAKSTGRALLEDYSLKNTQPHFYEEYVKKSEKTAAVNLLDIVGKPIELAVDLKQKASEDGKVKLSTGATAAASTPSGGDVDELTSPVMVDAGDDAKLELCEDVADELTAMEKDSPSIDAPPTSTVEDATTENRRRQFCKAKRPSDTCLESEY